MKVHDSPSYKSARFDLIKYIKSPQKVLDIGCNTGATGGALKQQFGKSLIVHGMDYNSDAVAESKQILDKAEVINLNNLSEFDDFIQYEKYDYVIIADVLEHILFPREIVQHIFKSLHPNGQVLISLPNTGFYPSFFHLLLHRWPRNSRGIYDRTHLTLYFNNNLKELSPENGELSIIERKYRWRESKGTKFDFLLKILNYIPYIRNFFTFQFLIKIEKKN